MTADMLQPAHAGMLGSKGWFMTLVTKHWHYGKIEHGSNRAFPDARRLRKLQRYITNKSQGSLPEYTVQPVIFEEQILIS